MPTVLVSLHEAATLKVSRQLELAQQLVEDLYQITITCAEEGKLAQQAHGDERNLLLYKPKETNDAGFAMTSSFYLCSWQPLVFDPSEEENQRKNG